MRLGGAQMHRAVGQPAALAKLGDDSRLWSPLALGNQMAAFWDAEDGSLSSGSIGTWTDRVGGVALTQAIGASKPIWSASSFNGRPGVTFDGTDDYLRAASSPFPLDGDVSEIWIFGSQDLLASTTGTRAAAGYGSLAGTGTRNIKRTVTSAVNHAVATCGNSGGTIIALTDTLLDYSGRHVQRAIYGPTTLGLEGDGLANTPVAMVPLSAAGSTTVGASNATTPLQYWVGIFNAIIFTKGLSASDAARLLAWGRDQRGCK